MYGPHTVIRLLCVRRLYEMDGIALSHISKTNCRSKTFRMKRMDASGTPEYRHFFRFNYGICTFRSIFKRLVVDCFLVAYVDILNSIDLSLCRIRSRN